MITLSSRVFARKHQISNYVNDNGHLLPRSGSVEQHPRTKPIIQYLRALTKEEFDPEMREFVFDEGQARRLVKLIIDMTAQDHERKINFQQTNSPDTPQEQRRAALASQKLAEADVFSDVVIKYDLFKLLELAYLGSFVWQNDGGEQEATGRGV
jgi:hypothetical protein